MRLLSQLSASPLIPSLKAMLPKFYAGILDASKAPVWLTKALCKGHSSASSRLSRFLSCRSEEEYFFTDSELSNSESDREDGELSEDGPD